jgi:hypothetical protein
MQSNEPEQFEENIGNKEATQELQAAREEVVKMQSNEIELKKKLEKVCIRVNVLLDHIEEKDETISILQETNQQLMSRRTQRVASRGSMRDPSEIMGDVDVLQEKRMSPAKNRLPRQNSRSLFSKPPSPASNSRRLLMMSFNDHDSEEDEENY